MSRENGPPGVHPGPAETRGPFFQDLLKTDAFSSEERREELLARLNQNEHVRIHRDRIDLSPSLDVTVLAPPRALEQFGTIFEWIVSLIRAGLD